MAQMILSKLGINSNNDKILASLSFVLFMPLLFDFIAGLTNKSNSVITMTIYGVSLVVIFYLGRKRIRMRNISLVLFLYIICLLNILIFPESKKYFDTAQYIMLFYFFPLGFIIFRTIQSWDNFIPILFIFAPLAIIMGIYILFFTQITKLDDSITYMEFSYALLPFVCASYAFYVKKRHIAGLLFYLIGLIEILSFGCRGALISTIVFAFLMSLNNSKQNIRMLIMIFIVFLAIAINVKSVVYYLTSLPFFEDSYVLNRALKETVFDVSSREIILNNCERRLSSMGLEVSGLFGDRPYCGSVYPHNIVYEILMQFGWIFGPLLLLYFALLFIKGLVHNTTSRFVTIFFICAVLLRFFASGSYLNSGLFWLMIACIQSLKNNRMTLIGRSLRNIL